MLAFRFMFLFANKNDNPSLLMEAALWWIQTYVLDDFKKAYKILNLIEQE